MKALLVSPAPAALLPLASHLAGTCGWEVAQAGSGEQALETAARERPAVVVFDERVRDLAAAEFARRLLAVDAAIHLAVATPRPEEEALERYEGLGLAACLPDRPGRRDAERLRRKLERLGAARP
jgi:DNA-binding response OmpR family regulator